MSDILAQLRAVNASNKPATEPCDLIAQLNAIKVRDKSVRHERAITLHKTEQQLRYMIDKNGQLKCATLASNPVRRGYKANYMRKYYKRLSTTTITPLQCKIMARDCASMSEFRERLRERLHRTPLNSECIELLERATKGHNTELQACIIERVDERAITYTR